MAISGWWGVVHDQGRQNLFFWFLVFLVFLFFFVFFWFFGFFVFCGVSSQFFCFFLDISIHILGGRPWETKWESKGIPAKIPSLCFSAGDHGRPKWETKGIPAKILSKGKSPHVMRETTGDHGIPLERTSFDLKAFFA